MQLIRVSPLVDCLKLQGIVLLKHLRKTQNSRTPLNTE